MLPQQKNSAPSLKVMLITEGNYPFYGGGISTWAHTLCNETKGIEYYIYSINANYESKYNCELPKSVKKVIQLPIWSPNEPHDYLNFGKQYYKIVRRKEITDFKTIDIEFVPLIKKLLDIIYSEKKDLDELYNVLFSMWSYFQMYDYKKTMTSKCVWDAYKNYMNDNATSYKQSTTLIDLTTGLRWVYRFLMPISIDVPKVNVSHITIAGFTVLPALIAKFKHNTPLILTEHGVFIRERLLAINSSNYSNFLKDFLIRFSESITRLVYYKSDLILSVNKFNTKWEKNYGADPKKIKIIYNGIDTDKFRPIIRPKTNDGRPTVVAAARIFELKDIITMIKSCNVARRTIPNVKYLIYGNKNAVPEYTKQCEALIKELNLENHFILAGHHSEPHKIFPEGDISILTSISEGFPYTVIESMSCGIPVVATDVGGVNEALNSDCGFLCKAKDYKDIAKKVITLLTDDKLRLQMGKNARARIIDNFAINDFISNYEESYKSFFNYKKTDKIHQKGKINYKSV